MFKMVPASTLRIGAVLSSPIYDQKNTKLLAAAIPITPSILDKLRERGVLSVAVDEADLARLNAFQAQGTADSTLPDRVHLRSQLENRVSRQLDLLSELEVDLDACRHGRPFSAQMQPHDGGSYDADSMNELLERHQAGIEQLDSAFDSLQAGDAINLDAITNLSNETLTQAARDMDLFVCLGISPAADSYPGRHSMHTAMLAMSIGAKLGLDQQTLTELGLGCMIHDAGMLRINEQTFQTRRVLSAGEFSEITKHPLRTFDLLERYLDDVPASSRMVAYQMHERCDGSGYPRGKTADAIHPLAKIAAVADAYVALVSKRPHRPAMLPYYAMAKMLEDVREGLYDPGVVRALLHTISLFPIGSYVELSDGRMAKTIRANGPSYDRPIVEIVGRTGTEVIDLTEAPDLKVVKARSNLEMAAAR